MSLRVLAESDLGLILEDGATGFGWPITLTNPAGATFAGIGFSDDIAQVIDPDTGELVSGRLASAAIRISTLYAAGFELPRAIADSDIKPWLVAFDDINGLPYTFKVRQSNPDRALGLITLVLEAYI